MAQMIPITDLEKTNEISDICHKSQEHILVTKNGYEDLVIMSIEVYKRLTSNTLMDSVITVTKNKTEGGATLLEERALEFQGKLGPYEDFDWGKPVGREKW